MSEPTRRDDAVALWASARMTELLGDSQEPPPKYGSNEWHRLAGNDPRKGAAVITAAELWRRFGDEEDLLAWFRDASRARAPLASWKTRAELDAAAKPKATRPVQAADGWPPVAIPGRPGWYRHFVDGRQVDAQRTEMVA